MFPPLLLGFVGLAVGLLPHDSASHFVAPAVAAIGHDASGVYLKLWHGFNLPLMSKRCYGCVRCAGCTSSEIDWQATVQPLQRLANWGPAARLRIRLENAQRNSPMAIAVVAEWATACLSACRPAIVLRTGRCHTQQNRIPNRRHMVGSETARDWPHRLDPGSRLDGDPQPVAAGRGVCTGS